MFCTSDTDNNNRTLRRKFEYVWKFLRENNCDTVDNVTFGMRCTICGNVMINAHCGPCGCRYCVGCVTDYLDGHCKFCPNNGEDCKQELLVIDETVIPDHAMNQEISRLIVKCPRDWCNYSNEVGKFHHHERVCKELAAKCPYCDIGCRQSPLASDEIDGHLANQNESHARLLIDCIFKLQSDIGAMKRNIAGLEIGRREQQKVADQQAMRIEHLHREMQALEHENRSMKEQIISLRVAGEMHRPDCTAQPMGAADQQISEIQATDGEQLREDTLMVERKMAVLDEEIISEPVQYDCCMNAQSPDSWINVENRHQGEFVWCIDQWSSRRQAARDDMSKEVIWSDAFHLHEQGYRMCLSVMPGADYLCIWWQLMRGPFDGYLSWPFKGDVILSVIDQKTRLDHTSATVRYDRYSGEVGWKKPTKDRNIGFWNGNRISLDELSRNSSVCRDDRILIRCIVEMRK